MNRIKSKSSRSISSREILHLNTTDISVSPSSLLEWEEKQSTLSEEEAVRYFQDKAIQEGFEICMKWFQYGPRSESETRDKLLSLVFTEEEIQAVLSKLKEYGLLDDLALLNQFVDHYLAKGYGFYYIQEKVKQKKFASSLISQYFDEICSSEKQIESASRWLKHSLYKDQAKQRQAEKLAQRGFPYRYIDTICRNAKEELSE